MNGNSLQRRGTDLAFIVVMAAYASFALTFFWDRPYLLTLLLLLPPITLGARLGQPKMVVVMLLTAAVLGSFTEICCVVGGLWTYAQTGGLPYVPLWNTLAWACFPPAFWLGAKIVFGEEVPTKSSTRSLVLALIGIAAMIVLFVYSENNGGPTVIMGFLMAAALIVITRQNITVLMMVVAIFIGPICESSAIASGAWHYVAPPYVLGLPAYMIPAYAVFGALMGHASQAAGALVLKKIGP